MKRVWTSSSMCEILLGLLVVTFWSMPWIVNTLSPYCVFRQGADDDMVKPVCLLELLGRLESRLAAARPSRIPRR